MEQQKLEQTKQWETLMSHVATSTLLTVEPSTTPVMQQVLEYLQDSRTKTKTTLELNAKENGENEQGMNLETLNALLQDGLAQEIQWMSTHLEALKTRISILSQDSREESRLPLSNEFHQELLSFFKDMEVHISKLDQIQNHFKSLSQFQDFLGVHTFYFGCSEKLTKYSIHD
jgi:hypothetical protein